MITGIVAILGALAGMVPALMQFLSLKANNAQQLALAQLQLQAAKDGGALQIDLANSQADIKQADHIYGFASGSSGNRFVDALAVFVRPYLTLFFFHLWVFIEVCLVIYGINSGYDLGQLGRLVWDENTANIFAAIIGFWFGDRMMLRGSERVAATLAVQPTVTAKAKAP